MDEPLKVVELAFLWGFGVVFGIGVAVWAAEEFLGIDLMAPFRRREK